MRNYPRTRWIALALLGLVTVPAFGQEEQEGVQNETLNSFRQAFEKRMNAELDEHGEKARILRKNYLEALQRLKAELGRETKLKEAAQVLAEIEAVQDGDEAQPLPGDADNRYKRVRKKWDDGLADILEERGKKLGATVGLYFKALDSEKRKLTRAGRIKEALLFEEEEKRVRELPEVKAVLANQDSEKETPEGDLALASRGAKVKGAEDGRYLIDGKSTGYEQGRYAWATIPCNMEVTLNEVYELSRIRFLLWDADQRSYRYRLAISKDGTAWETIKDTTRTGASSWQDIKFRPREVQHIRITGLGNTAANNRFHVVEVEAYRSDR